MIRTLLPALAVAGLIAAPTLTGVAFAADTKPAAPAKPAAAATAAKPAADAAAKPAAKKHKKHKTHAAAPSSSQAAK